MRRTVRYSCILSMLLILHMGWVWFYLVADMGRYKIRKGRGRQQLAEQVPRRFIRWFEEMDFHVQVRISRVENVAAGHCCFLSGRLWLLYEGWGDWTYKHMISFILADTIIYYLCHCLDIYCLCWDIGEARYAHINFVGIHSLTCLSGCRSVGGMYGVASLAIWCK